MDQVSLIVLIAVLVIAVGVPLLVIVISALTCFWQAKRVRAGSNPEKAAAAASTKRHLCSSDHYELRAYCGCMLRRKSARQQHKLWTRWKRLSDCTLRACWFKLCRHCCQELEGEQPFLDEIHVSTHQAMVVTRAAPAEKFAQQQPPSMAGGDLPNVPTTTHQPLHKISILSPDPILVTRDRYGQNVEPITEEAETQEFYAYQLHCASNDKVMY